MSLKQQRQWSTAAHLRASHCSALEMAWLQYSGSLTDALEKLTHHQAQWILSQESYNIPRQDEGRALKLPPRSIAYIREGGWSNQGILWIATRAVIPLTTLNEPGSPLKNLGTIPMGKILFTLPQMKRHPFEFQAITAQHPDYSHHSAHLSLEAKETRLWARRSLFSLDKALLLVSETFLPAFFAQASSLP